MRAVILALLQMICNCNKVSLFDWNATNIAVATRATPFQCMALTSSIYLEAAESGTVGRNGSRCDPVRFIKRQK
jgi:hypothetical protein